MAWRKMFQAITSEKAENYPEKRGRKTLCSASQCTLFDHSPDMYTGNSSSGGLRWIADIAVMGAFQSRVLDLPDFYFTGDDYRYRFEPEAKQRFLDLLRERFNCRVKYRGCALKWDTVIEQKANELGRFLVGKSTLDFAEP